MTVVIKNPRNHLEQFHNILLNYNDRVNNALDILIGDRSLKKISV